MSVTVATYSSIRDVPAELWDRAVSAENAPIFYDRCYLLAYEAAPLHPVESIAYLVASSTDGGDSHAVLPVFVQRPLDPLGVISAVRSDIGAETPGLVSPGWHCYDGHIPGTGRSPELLRALIEAMRSVARDNGVEWCAIINVEERASLSGELPALGFVRAGVDERFATDLGRGVSVDSYVAGLRPKARYNLRRYWRRAAEAGLETRVCAPADADLDCLLTLARQTAAKFGNADFYRAGVFQRFVRLLGERAPVIELRLGGRLIAGGVCLVDERRFHTWTCGVDYDAAPTFSPYTLLFGEAVRAALAAGVPTLEGGRRNAPFKTRHGLQRRLLRSYVTAAR